ncbi:hypothetical protein [Cupriavidus sp. YAF13]|uniref:hypothetical protein n=1 Tax=Cupriavidus sp. YAF13 TaxID=3233075 RepID=UPI003F92534F
MLPLEGRRLIAIALLLCVTWPRVSAGALAWPPSEGIGRASGCKTLVDIARDSLLSDLDAGCPPAYLFRCEGKNRGVKSIIDYIDAQRQQGGDECDIALEVLDRIRALPPQH